MSGSVNVLFCDNPLSVAISTPLLNGGNPPAVGGGSGLSNTCAPGTDAGGCVVAPGNGIGAIQQGQNKFPVVALQNMPAYRAVVFGAGGVRIADVANPDDRDILVGIVTNSPLAGQSATVAHAGLVVNTLSGTAGWNFVVNGKVYVGADGILTQTAPVLNWSRVIGFAVASNAVLLSL